MTIDNLPLITIGIPTKNRSQYVRKVLDALSSLQYPKEKIKLVFVDDYSTDGTYEILTEWSSKINKSYYDIALVQEQTNIPQARNICIKHMVGDYLLFWDSDVIPPGNLLKEMISIMREDPSLGIIGADYTYDASLHIKYKPTVNKMTHAVYMGFTLIRREVFDVVGGFNENLSVGEDTEFCIRVMEKTNYRIMWAPEPVLHLKRPEDRKGLATWLKYNFSVRAEEYYRSFKNLPRFLKARILYYMGLPWIMIISFISFLINMPILASILLMYPVPSVWLVVKQRGLKDGITTWLKFNAPTGLALSYGIVRAIIKKRAKDITPSYCGKENDDTTFYHIANRYFYSPLKDFGALAFALGFVTFLDRGFFEAFMFALRVLILSLSLQAIYGWCYVVGEFMTKYEPPELRTLRFNKAITIRDVITSFLLRTVTSQLLLLLALITGIFSLYVYLRTFPLWGLLVVTMILHHVLGWEMRSLITLPLLKILQVLYIFLPVLIEPSAKYWTFVYAFTITLPHILNYFGTKFARSTLKISCYVLTFTRDTYTIRKNILHKGFVFLVFVLIQPLVFNGSLEQLKMIFYPVLIIIPICIYDLFRRVLYYLGRKHS